MLIMKTGLGQEERYSAHEDWSWAGGMVLIMKTGLGQEERYGAHHEDWSWAGGTVQCSS